MDQSTRRFLGYISAIPFISVIAFFLYRDWYFTPYLCVISVALCFDIWIINTDFLFEEDKSILFIQTIMVLETFTVWIFSELLLILVFGYHALIFDIIKKFEPSQITTLYNEVITAIGFSGLASLTTLIFIMLYFFHYIKQKHGYIFDTEEDGSKYAIGFIAFLNKFSTFFILIFDIYLFINAYYFEFLLITLTYATTWYIVSTVSSSYNEIISSHRYLQQIQRMVNNEKAYSRTHPLDDKINTDKIIDSLVWRLFTIREPFSEVISLSTFLIIGIGLVFHFNILSIIVLESCFVFLYWQSTIISALPVKRFNLEITSGLPFNNVFILREYKSGDYLVLTTENKQIQVHKQNILNRQETTHKNDEYLDQFN